MFLQLFSCARKPNSYVVVACMKELGKFIDRVRMPITANKHNSVFLIESFEKLINDSCGFDRIKLIFHRHRGRETVFEFI